MENLCVCEYTTMDRKHKDRECVLGFDYWTLGRFGGSVCLVSKLYKRLVFGMYQYQYSYKIPVLLYKVVNITNVF